MAAPLQIYAAQKNWRSQVVERLGAPSLATDATTGFLMVPTMAGTPTGTPDPLIPGLTPMVVDESSGSLYIYTTGAWHQVSGGGGGGYHADAVHFDGSTWLSTASLVSTENTKWSWGGWFRISDGTGQSFWVSDPHGNYGTYADATDIASLLRGQTHVCPTAGSPLVTAYTATAPTIFPGAWVFILFSIDTDLSGASVYQAYVNNTLGNGPASAYHPFTIASNGLPFFVFDDDSGNPFIGDAADVWIAPGVSLLDGSGTIPLATRRLFIDADGRPVNPAVAIAALGAPCMMFTGDAASFGTNQGPGGAFTTTGALTNANSSPSD